MAYPRVNPRWNGHLQRFHPSSVCHLTHWKPHGSISLSAHNAGGHIVLIYETNICLIKICFDIFSLNCSIKLHFHETLLLTYCKIYVLIFIATGIVRWYDVLPTHMYSVAPDRMSSESFRTYFCFLGWSSWGSASLNRDGDSLTDGLTDSLTYR